MGGSAEAARQEFEVFVAEVSGPLLRTAFLMTGNLTDAEDAVQETLLRVARRWHRVRKMGHPLAYARRILVNLMLDEARGTSRRQGELNGIFAARTGALSDASAERALQTVDSRLELAGALACLAPRQRAVVVLRYWADLPEAEVAAVLGCSVGNVKSTSSRALARLRELMAAERPATARDRGLAGDVDRATAPDSTEQRFVPALKRSSS